MSTDTDPTASTADPPWFATVGRYAIVGLTGYAALLVLTAWNVFGLAPGQTWSLDALGYNPGSLVLMYGTPYVAAVTITAAATDHLSARLNGPARILRAGGYLASAALVTPILVTAWWSPLWPSEPLLLGLYAVGGLVFVAPAAALGVCLVDALDKQPMRRVVLVAGTVVLLGIAIPTGIGAVADAADTTRAEPVDASENQTDDSGDWVYEPLETQYPSQTTVEIEDVRDDTPVANLSKRIPYDVAERRQLRGRLVLNTSPSELRHDVYVENFNTTSIPRYRIHHLGAFHGNGSTAVSIPLEPHPHRVDMTIVYPLPCEFVLGIEIVEDGRVVRYQAPIDLSKTVDACA